MQNPLLIVLFLSVVGAVGVLFLLLRHRIRFEIRIGADAVTVARGDPPHDFVIACQDISRQHRLRSGRIRCVQTGGGPELRFSDDIPDRLHQRFRNNWEPPPSGGGGGGMRAAG